MNCKKYESYFTGLNPSPLKYSNCTLPTECICKLRRILGVIVIISLNSIKKLIFLTKKC